MRFVIGHDGHVHDYDGSWNDPIYSGRDLRFPHFVRLQFVQQFDPLRILAVLTRQHLYSGVQKCSNGPRRHFASHKSSEIGLINVALAALMMGYVVFHSNATPVDELSVAVGSLPPADRVRSVVAPGVDLPATRQGESVRALAPALPPARAESEVHDPVWDSAKRLYVEKFTRTTHGADYVDAVECIAKDTVRKNIAALTQNRAADFARFSSWESMDTRLVELSKSDPAAAVSLSRLIDESLSASGFAEVCAIRAWGDPMHLEQFDPSGPHDSKVWLEQHQTSVKGLYRFTTSTRVGDRQFCLHFDSADFPELEDELRSLDLVKSDYWDQFQSH